jgi:hypothetical protein
MRVHRDTGGERGGAESGQMRAVVGASESVRFAGGCTVQVVVGEHVVAVSPQSRLAANEVPDLTHRPPRRADPVRRDPRAPAANLRGEQSVS